MLKVLLAATLVAVTLAGCVVYPARPAYYRGPVVVY
jgi:3-polyprenyl-4-hydroxybenzoate decarboxylase